MKSPANRCTVKVTPPKSIFAFFQPAADVLRRRQTAVRVKHGASGPRRPGVTADTAHRDVRAALFR